MRVLFVGLAGWLLSWFIVNARQHFQQGHELKGKCGLSEIVLLRFNLDSVEEDHGVGGRPVIVLHRMWFFHFAAYRSCGRGEAVVKAPQPAGYDSEGPVKPLYALGHPPRLID